MTICGVRHSSVVGTYTELGVGRTGFEPVIFAA